MDQVIWVELLSRHGDVVARHRCGGRGIRIGRAYTNDVVLDDPHVAPEHVHVVREENGDLVVEDLGSANGLFAGHGKHRVQRIVAADDRPFRIGNTYLRVRLGTHFVAPERLFEAKSRSWPAVLALAVLLLGIEAASLWLTQTSEPSSSRYLLPLLGIVVFVAGWAALWAVMSRIFSGQAHFEANLVIALAGMLFAEIFTELTELGAFGLSWNALVNYRYVGFWCIIAAVCIVHLRRINPSRLELKGGVVVALFAIAIAVQTMVQSDTRSGFDQDRYVRRLLPPALRVAPLQDEASFFAAVGKLQGKIDEDRAEEP